MVSLCQSLAGVGSSEFMNGLPFDLANGPRLNAVVKYTYLEDLLGVKDSYKASPLGLS